MIALKYEDHNLLITLFCKCFVAAATFTLMQTVTLAGGTAPRGARPPGLAARHRPAQCPPFLPSLLAGPGRLGARLTLSPLVANSHELPDQPLQRLLRVRREPAGRRRRTTGRRSVTIRSELQQPIPSLPLTVHAVC